LTEIVTDRPEKAAGDLAVKLVHGNITRQIEVKQPAIALPGRSAGMMSYV